MFAVSEKQRQMNHARGDAMDIDDVGYRDTGIPAAAAARYSVVPKASQRELNPWVRTQKLISSNSDDTESVDMFSSEVESGSSAEPQISSVAYSPNGKFVAVGKSNGKIAVYEKDREGYKELTTFVSHSRDFDYLRSLEIEETINKITWCASPNGSNFILSTNDKTIKLWRVDQKRSSIPSVPPPAQSPFGGSRAMMSAKSRTRMRNHVLSASQYFKKSRRRRSSSFDTNETVGDENCRCKARRVYKNAHAYHINSISVSSDGETFLSADDLRVNLWHADRSKCCFTAVDMKPPSMDTLSEVLTAAVFHPFQSHIFAYSTSTGTVKLADMRAAARCDKSVKNFKDTTSVSPNSFFAEILDCISDIQFTNNGHQLLLRDYLSLKLWDARMERRPSMIIDMQGYLVPKLRELYMRDLIFDKFKCAISRDDSTFVTGTYGGVACAFARTTGKLVAAFNCEAGTTLSPPTARKCANVDDPMWQKKAIHCTFDPKSDVVALSTSSDLSVFSRRGVWA